MLTVKFLVAALAVWWLFMRRASAATGVISAGPNDFDPITAGQLGSGGGGCRTDGLIGCSYGGVTVGDDWSATFVTGNGNWADGYRSHASSDDNDPREPGGLPL